MSNKFTGQEWAAVIERGLKRHECDLTRQREQLLLTYLPIPIALGIIACIMYVVFWGWGAWFQTFLSWVIGVTIVTATVAIFARPGRRHR